MFKKLFGLASALSGAITTLLGNRLGTNLILITITIILSTGIEEITSEANDIDLELGSLGYQLSEIELELSGIRKSGDTLESGLYNIDAELTGIRKELGEISYNIVMK